MARIDLGVASISLWEATQSIEQVSGAIDHSLGRISMSRRDPVRGRSASNGAAFTDKKGDSE